MKPLRIKKRTSAPADADAAALDAVPDTASPTAVSEPPALIPCPPPARHHEEGEQPHPHAGRPSSAASSTASQRPPNAARAGVKFASELDSANVEAYLEYLTRPHTSWDSATRHLAHRRDVIEGHRASVFARSLASSRRSSFASTMRSEAAGYDDGPESTFNASVASAPAGFPRSASNSSRTHTGTLRKGRLGEANASPSPSPDTLVATGTTANAVWSPPPTSHSTRTGSQPASSHSVSGSTQRAGTNKGRLSRGAALTAPRPARAAAPPSSAAAGPELMVGGTPLQASANVLSLAPRRPSNTTVGSTSRGASRDGGGMRQEPKGKRKAGSA